MKSIHTITAMVLFLASTTCGQAIEIERNASWEDRHTERPLPAQKMISTQDERNLHHLGLSTDLTFLAVKGKIQKLDSIVYQNYNKNTQKWMNDEKDEFFYDARGENVTAISFQWNDTTKRWQGQKKNCYLYDGYGNVTQNLSYRWNQTTKLWEGYARNDYSYDLSMHLTQNVFYNWDKTAEEWAESQKAENVYDSLGNIRQRIKYKAWDKTLNQWIPDEKEEITYDTLGNYVSSTMHKYDETIPQWNISSKTEWRWNIKSILINCTTFNWDKALSQWVNSITTDYISDTTGNHTQVVSYSWDKISGQWVGSYKSEYTYNPGGKLTLSVVYSWNKTSKVWVSNRKTEISYDANGKLQKDARYNWNVAGNKWIGTLQREYAYDTSRNKILEMFYSWNTNSGQWVMSDKEEYIYDGTVSSSDLLFGDDCYLSTLNDTVFTKLTGTVSYSRDAGSGQMVYSYKRLLYYSPFFITGDTTKALICEGKSYSFMSKIYNKAGFYSDTLISSKGADSIIFLSLSVHPAYQPKVEVRGDTLVSPDPYSSYQWYTDAGIIEGATKSKYVISKGGIYHLVVTDGNGCTNTSAPVTAIHSSAEGSKTKALSYTLFPNPCTGRFAVRLNSSSRERISIHLLNPVGQVVESRQVDLSGEGHMERFNLSHQGRGIYLLVITSGNHQSVGKMVVQ